MGRGAAYPKVCTDHVPEYISLRNTTDSPSDCPLVTSPLLPLLSGVAHHRFAPHLHSPSCGPSLPFPPPSIPAICCLPTCSSCIPGLSTTLSSESPQSDECRLVAKHPWDAETASTIQPVVELTHPHKRLCFEKYYNEGGATRLWGPAIKAGSWDNNADYTWWVHSDKLNMDIPLPRDRVPIIEEDE